MERLLKCSEPLGRRDYAQCSTMLIGDCYLPLAFYFGEVSLSLFSDCLLLLAAEVGGKQHEDNHYVVLSIHVQIGYPLLTDRNDIALL